MDCDYDPQNIQESKFKKQTRSSHRKGHKKSKFAEIISKEKPVFNPTDKTFQQYVDEYYSLEFEDIVGDIPCRFKYRKVIPNSFGLTVEEVKAIQTCCGYTLRNILCFFFFYSICFLDISCR